MFENATSNPPGLSPSAAILSSSRTWRRLRSIQPGWSAGLGFRPPGCCRCNFHCPPGIFPLCHRVLLCINSSAPQYEISWWAMAIFSFFASISSTPRVREESTLFPATGPIRICSWCAEESQYIWNCHAPWCPVSRTKLQPIPLSELSAWLLHLFVRWQLWL